MCGVRVSMEVMSLGDENVCTNIFMFWWFKLQLKPNAFQRLKEASYNFVAA